MATLSACHGITYSSGDVPPFPGSVPEEVGTLRYSRSVIWPGWAQKVVCGPRFKGAGPRGGPAGPPWAQGGSRWAQGEPMVGGGPERLRLNPKAPDSTPKAIFWENTGIFHSRRVPERLPTHWRDMI